MCAAARKDQSTEKLKLLRGGLRAHVYWDGGFTEVPLEPGIELVFGRGQDCDVVLDDPSVSRAHARLVTGPPIAIVDLGSANGTHVDGVPTPENKPVHLRFGALVELGDAILVVRTPPDTASGENVGAPARAFADQAALLDVARRLSRSNIAFSVVGEAGAGKRYFADLVHSLAPHEDRPFVRVGCADWSESTIDRELFGCARGYGRPSDTEHKGALQRAEGGTLFLDRVASLPSRIQDKLARALDQRKFQRLGEELSRPIDCRVIAGDRNALETSLSAGTVRPGLYHQVAGVVVHIPALRDRGPEFAELVQIGLTKAAAQLKRPVPTLDPSVHELLREYSFPDNFRELLHVLRTALLASDKLEIGVADLPARLHAVLSDKRRRNAPLKAELDEVLRARILQALEDCDGNQTKAARVLGLPRRTLVARLDALGIPRPRKGKRSTK
ncbi:MAG TPA: sigma 54-interacting transcriptional regulator [Polyangiaceae bacterium]|nr:sigma 54-interacting transcriptional regulator [Polyangiaceae bacterium]